jgi:hypothetical protein
MFNNPFRHRQTNGEFFAPTFFWRVVQKIIAREKLFSFFLGAPHWVLPARRAGLGRKIDRQDLAGHC